MRPRSEPAPDVEIVTRMKLDRITDVDYHGHSRLRLTQRHHLRFAQLGPITLIRLSLVGVPVSELDEVKRKCTSPRFSPIANHDREKCAVLIGTPGVTLALIPNDTSNREWNERRDHRVVK